jgi:hypothetical protein
VGEPLNFARLIDQQEEARGALLDRLAGASSEADPADGQAADDEHDDHDPETS